MPPSLRRKERPVSEDYIPSLPYADGSSTTDTVEPTEERKIVQATSVSDYLKDQVLFTLAPIYYMVVVPFDISMQFKQSELGKDATILKLSTTETITGDIPGWEHVVESVDSQHWDRLVQFMSELMFQKSDAYWSVCGEFVELPAKAGGKIKIAVFTPRTQTKKVVPWVDIKGVIRFNIIDSIAATFNNKLKLFSGGL